MKITIFLLIALFTIAHAEPSCDLDSMCMGCDATTADKCTACYNGTVATYGARYMSSNACGNKITALTGCATYYPNNTAADVSGAQTTFQTPCWACESGKHLTATNSEATAYNVNSAVTGAVGATWSCAGTSATPITGCAVVIDITPGNTGTAGSTCLITNAGLCHKTDAKTDPTNECATPTAMTNCSNTIATWTGSNVGTFSCHNAKTGFAVKSDGTDGIAYTTDTNCRKLLDTTNCGTCTDGYWFGGSKCFMASNMFFLSAVAFFVAWFF